MQKLITFIAKSFRNLFSKFRIILSNTITWWKFYSNNTKFKRFSTNGIPFVMVARNGSLTIGDNLKLNNKLYGNPIGRPQPCIFFVDHNAEIHIGNNVGLSSTALVAHKKINIGNNVKIGGGVCIYDTDFHSLHSIDRLHTKSDKDNESKSEVIIEENVFIGAHSTILKGVSIGTNSIIGACSVVTKSIPPNEIWAGNPAKFIRKI
jgi:acetyltransferase-like isoleucine patch superfamily enzyme